MMIAKILMQITNCMMAVIVAYVNDTFFVHFEKNNAYILFSNFVFLGCFLSFTLFIYSVWFKANFFEKVSPYDSFMIFVALIGCLVTAVPFLLAAPTVL